jgi:adenine-specific DNA methylase
MDRKDTMTDTPRLIEVAFPLKQASLDSVHEKNVRHGHISTLHIWPARRPLAACRAAMIAAMATIQPRRDELLREVKGRARVGEVEVSANEWAKACNRRESYWSAVVDDCATPHPRLLRVRDPFGNLLAKAKGGVLIGASDVVASATE